jgi:FkbM family methyltransferase
MAALRPSLRSRATGVVVKTAQGYFCLDPDEQFVSRSLIDAGAYGVGEIEQARGFIRPESRVLVVGAHIGTIAIPLSRACAQLVAIEANPATYELLALNVAMNGCANIALHHVAANDREAPIEFVMNTHNSGGSKRMPLHRDAVYFHDNPRIAQVRGVRLDELLPEQAFDLVFMDIEGSEYFAFLGMQRILSGARTLIVEFLPHHLSRVAGVSVEQFLAPLAPNFDWLTVPTLGVRKAREGFLPLLRDMYERGHGDAGIVFQKDAGRA